MSEHLFNIFVFSTQTTPATADAAEIRFQAAENWSIGKGSSVLLVGLRRYGPLKNAG